MRAIWIVWLEGQRAENVEGKTIFMRSESKSGVWTEEQSEEERRVLVANGMAKTNGMVPFR